MRLFISDLDGTLLNDSREVSPFTARVINGLSKRGLRFSVATARTAATVTGLLKDIRFNTPLVLMNGVALYDIRDGRYVSVEVIPAQAQSLLHDCVKSNGSVGFFYSIEDNRLHTEYVNTDTPNAEAFLRERFVRYGKKFVRKGADEVFSRPLCFYSVSDTPERLDGMYSVLKNAEGLHCDYYPDNYNPGFMYLEVCSAAATKQKGVEKLCQLCGFDGVTVFGDNINDLPLMRAGDVRVAVRNAQPAVKAMASVFTASNNDDGVARELLRVFNITTEEIP